MSLYVITSYKAPNKMKAVFHTQYGTPDVLSIKEIEKPVPRAHDLLVQVHSATVNRTDCAVISAQPFVMRFFTGLLKPKLQVTGTDFAGVVVEVGQEVSRFKVGDRVYGFNDIGASSHAEYLAISEHDAVLTIPERFTFQQAAASVEAAHWAFNFINKIKLSPGQNVLVNGASGGIGSALVQFAKYYGAFVTAVCGCEQFDAVRSLGADKLIDYTSDDFTRYDEKYDVIMDAVGKSTYYKCRHLLKDKGVYISSEPGPYYQNFLLPAITAIQGNKKVIFPFPKSIKESMAFVRGLIEDKHFVPMIDREYPIDQVKEAFMYVASGQKIGNVILRLQ